MRTLSWNISFQNVFCHEFDIFHRSRTWVTAPKHVWMLATAGHGLYYRKEKPNASPLPVAPGGLALHYLAPKSWRFVDVRDENPLHLITLRFEVEDESGHDILANYSLPETFSPESQKKLATLMHGILAEFDRDTLSAQAELRRLLGAFLGTVLELAESQPTSKSPGQPKRCRKAMSYLREHYAEKLDIDRLAQLCNMSRPHFFRLFRKETQLTAQEYLRQQRLDHAKELLRFTEKSVAEIGQDVGWADQFHFSRVFRRETGCSPSKFREQNLT